MSAETLSQMFASTLSDDYESDASWEAVTALQTLGSREVFDQAVLWCRSPEPMKRARGADILAQLGKTAENPINTFAEESFTIVSHMLTAETEPLPISSAICALGHIGDPRAVTLLVRYRSHPDATVRFATAFALGQFADEELALPALMELMGDDGADVRDWAKFGIGVLGNRDSPEIRDALAARLSDPCSDAREEAMVGLAKRQDHRVLSTLISCLEASPGPDRAVEAASEMLCLSDPEVAQWNASDYAAALRQRFIV